MNETIPQQVSTEQASSESSEFALPNRTPSSFSGRQYAFNHSSSLYNNHFHRSVQPHAPRFETHERIGEGARLTESPHRPYTNGYLQRREDVERNPVRSDSSRTQAVYTQPRYPAYARYSDRLRTYARWRHTRPGTTTLANAGFFYTNESDLVRCFQCGLGLVNFAANDNPLKEHVRKSENCAYLKEVLDDTTFADFKNQIQREDQTASCHDPDEVIESTNYMRHNQPEYRTFERRLTSFTNWSPVKLQTPTQLAEAGFYHSGPGDRVRCFSCGGGLQSWDPDDDPWTEHCRWFASCPYAREQKGEEFIALVQASAALENEESTPYHRHLRQNEQPLSRTIDSMVLRESEHKSLLDQHRDTCVEMGYRTLDISAAIHELINRGKPNPTLEEIIDTIEVIQARRETDRLPNPLEPRPNETPVEENLRLKKSVYCMFCGKNNINALFLPCTHHRLCMECAEPLDHCPICEKLIRQKIRTFMS